MAFCNLPFPRWIVTVVLAATAVAWPGSGAPPTLSGITGRFAHPLLAVSGERLRYRLLLVDDDARDVLGRSIAENYRGRGSLLFVDIHDAPSPAADSASDATSLRYRWDETCFAQPLGDLAPTDPGRAVAEGAEARGDAVERGSGVRRKRPSLRVRARTNRTLEGQPPIATTYPDYRQGGYDWAHEALVR